MKISEKIKSSDIEEQLKEFLISDEVFISIEEARKELDKKYPKN